MTISLIRAPIIIGMMVTFSIVLRARDKEEWIKRYNTWRDEQEQYFQDQEHMWPAEKERICTAIDNIKDRISRKQWNALANRLKQLDKHIIKMHGNTPSRHLFLDKQMWMTGSRRLQIKIQRLEGNTST